MDQLLEQLRNATIAKTQPAKVISEQKASTSGLHALKNHSNQHQVKGKHESCLSELDDLIKNLGAEKQRQRELEVQKTSLLQQDVNFDKSTDDLHTPFPLPTTKLTQSNPNRNSENMEFEKSIAAKELQDLLDSVSTFQTNTLKIPKSPLKSISGNSFQTQKSYTPPMANLCSGCSEPINGQVITALGSLWHPNHFVCYHCEKVIGTSIFYEKDRKPYCEHDYLSLFSPKCALCTSPILDKMLTALNKNWHPECFHCSTCQKLLNDESFLEKGNEAFCKNCYEEKMAPKCQRCTIAIMDNFISAMGVYWHPNCFVCSDCGLPFNNCNFFEYEGYPYCEKHYHERRGSLCASCRQPINGRCITAMNRKFHPEHFVCTFCMKQLNKGTFKDQNDKPYCHPCYFKLFP